MTLKFLINMQISRTFSFKLTHIKNVRRTHQQSKAAAFVIHGLQTEYFIINAIKNSINRKRCGNQ